MALAGVFVLLRALAQVFYCIDSASVLDINILSSSLHFHFIKHAVCFLM